MIKHIYIYIYITFFLLCEHFARGAPPNRHPDQLHSANKHNNNNNNNDIF